MAVEVGTINILSAGQALITGFTDTMAVAPGIARNILSPPSEDWIYLNLSGDTPTAGPFLPNFTFGNALAGGGLGLASSFVSYAGTTYSMACGISPVVCYVKSPYYTSLTKFVQCTFDSAAAMIGCIGICNFIDTSGTGAAGSSNINHDAYMVDLSPAGVGAGADRLQRFNSGAGPTSLNAGVALVVNDVIRASFDFTNPAQVTVTVKKNGVTQYTVVDNNVNRMPSSGLAFPVIAVYSIAGGASFKAKNFSCGVGL
jgi:hypothetical protein